MPRSQGLPPGAPSDAPPKPRRTSDRTSSRLGPDASEADGAGRARVSFYPEQDEFEDEIPPLLVPRRDFSAPGASPSRAPSAPAASAPRASSSGSAGASSSRTSNGASNGESRGESRRSSSTSPNTSGSKSGASAKSDSKTPSKSNSKREPRGLWFEVGGVLCAALGAVLAWNSWAVAPQGWLPSLILGALRTLFGIGAYVVPVLACVLGVLLIAKKQQANLRAFWRGSIVSLLVLLCGVHLGVPLGEEFEPERLSTRGGLAGASVAWALRRLLGEAGAAIAIVALAIVALLLLTEVSLGEIAGKAGRALGRSSDAWRKKVEEVQDRVRQKIARRKEASNSEDSEEDEEDEEDDAEEDEEEARPSPRPRRSRQAVPQVLAGDEPTSFDAQILSRAQEEERARRSPFFPAEAIGAHEIAPQPPVAPEAQASAPQVLEAASPTQVLGVEAAHIRRQVQALDVPPHLQTPPDRLSSVRVEIDLAPPPASIVDASVDANADAVEPSQVLESSVEDADPPARDASLVPINAQDDSLSPVEALEAQAAASAREEDEASKPRRRPAGIRRTFGDGPPMPEYFDHAVRSLDPPIVPDLVGVEDDIRDSITTVEETLLSFKVDARVTDVKRGPVITRYEVQPAAGVRVAAIANLDRDLARALSAHAVRIEAPVPGKNVVGIEIPNKKVHLVRLRDVLELPEFLSAPSKLAFVLGKDIAGQPKWADLTKMPHMLVAGATNSGKSVCLNAIITSIIARASPDEVKFSLIDPKRVELTLYRDIPHLYHPVVVEPKDAVKVLRGMIVEMDRRYKKFAEARVRNIVSYNASLDEDEMPLPYIVIVIDELADLMMTAAAEFEKLICRLAQLARATGIHLIVATQRPSVNVITGVIKANIPARIAFAVASQVDSRTILDAVGAERLIGSGDMLFDANNGGKATRIQGAYLSEDEVNRIVQVVKGAYRDEPREYGLDLNSLDDASDEADDKPASTSRAMPDDRRDEMYDEVREFILRHQEVSASMIQRKYEIGFPRAARIVDQFERDGLLGPADGPKPRKVLGGGG